MLFIHTLDKVLSGEKTQTRRIIKPGQWLNAEPVEDETDYLTVFTERGRKLYQVGQTLAVQPGRGKPAVARIRITGIRREDVRNISDEDVKAEGFGNDTDDFLETWCSMHDPSILPMYTAMYRRGWLEPQPAERYQAWVIVFVLVK